jgi:small subunit ribosomal protein S25e
LGGPKKKGISQAEKAQSVSQKKSEEGAKKPKTTKPPEKRIGSITIPDVNSKDLLDELVKMKAITPYQVSSRFGLKISVAKDLLEELTKRKLIRYVGGSSRLRIYTTAEPA